MNAYYEDPDALHIELEYEDRELFAQDSLPGFCQIDAFDCGSYKDRWCILGISHRDSDGSHWSFQWSALIRSEDPSGDDYNMDSYIHRVEPIKNSVTGRIMDWVRSRP